MNVQISESFSLRAGRGVGKSIFDFNTLLTGLKQITKNIYIHIYISPTNVNSCKTVFSFTSSSRKSTGSESVIDALLPFVQYAFLLIN